MEKEQIIYLPTKSLKPYKGNPRKNTESVDAVAASISAYGFRNPIVIDENNVVINGHARLKAAKKLNLEEVPCLRVSDLTEEQIRKYRLIDNKTSEYALWDAEMLGDELADLDLSGMDFDFDFTGDLKKQKKWEESKKKCDLKEKAALRWATGAYYHSLFKSGKEGKPLKELKVKENVRFFSATAIEHIKNLLGGNLSECGWCLLTTPRRRHKGEFHFATTVCEDIAYELRIPFYADAFHTENFDRTHPNFVMDIAPAERNVILYDDILTTGCTVDATRKLLMEAGYTVCTVVSIDNH